MPDKANKAWYTISVLHCQSLYSFCRLLCGLTGYTRYRCTFQAVFTLQAQTPKMLVTVIVMILVGQWSQKAWLPCLTGFLSQSRITQHTSGMVTAQLRVSWKLRWCIEVWSQRLITSTIKSRWEIFSNSKHCISLKGYSGLKNLYPWLSFFGFNTMFDLKRDHIQNSGSLAHS